MSHKVNNSPTNVTLYNVRKVQIIGTSVLGEVRGAITGVDVVFSMEQREDNLAMNMLAAVMTHFGVDRHYELVRDLITKPGVLDRLEGKM